MAELHVSTAYDREAGAASIEQAPSFPSFPAAVLLPPRNPLKIPNADTVVTTSSANPIDSNPTPLLPIPFASSILLLIIAIDTVFTDSPYFNPLIKYALPLTLFPTAMGLFLAAIRKGQVETDEDDKATRNGRYAKDCEG